MEFLKYKKESETITPTTHKNKIHECEVTKKWENTNNTGLTYKKAVVLSCGFVNIAKNSVHRGSVTSKLRLKHKPRVKESLKIYGP